MTIPRRVPCGPRYAAERMTAIGATSRERNEWQNCGALRCGVGTLLRGSERAYNARWEGAMPLREVLLRPPDGTAGGTHVAEPGEAER